MMLVSDSIRHKPLAEVRSEDFAGIQRCEAAFVLLLSSPLNDRILQLREACKALGDPEAQPVPHITVLFLGSRTPAQLWRAADVIESILVRPMGVTLGSFGLFGSGPLVRNLHCRLGPSPDITALHKTSLDALGVIGTDVERRKYAL